MFKWIAIPVLALIPITLSVQYATYTEPKVSAPEPVSVLFLGDMMFDRGVRVKANAIGYENIFGSSSEIIQSYDLAVANLEGPVTSFLSKNIDYNTGKSISGFQFTFDPKVATTLEKVGIDIVSLANNHSQNFGNEGLKQTREFLQKNNVDYFGVADNDPNVIATTTCVKDICFGMIGWNELGYANDQYILPKIKEMNSQVDYVVVYPHWGIEYETKPNKKQTDLAHAWIDAGADVIIGAHPHVIQTIEVYNGKYIFYSLGNFIFDQYFSFNTTHGLGVSANFYKDKVEYKILPFSSVGSRVSVPNEKDSLRIMNLLRTVSEPSLIDGLH